MLKYAEKYNWWTKEDEKKNISPESKIEYLLERGTLDELRKALRECGGEKIFKVWQERIEGKKKLKRRENVIKFFVNAHKNFKVIR